MLRQTGVVVTAAALSTFNSSVLSSCTGQLAAAQRPNMHDSTMYTAGIYVSNSNVV